VVSLEHPELWGGLVDLPAAPAADEAAWLARGLAGGDDEDQLALRDGVRHVARLLPAPLAAPSAPPAFRADASYLVTGGLGGIGLQVARWLVAHGARHLVLIGRTGLPPEETWPAVEDPEARKRIDVLRALRASGARVRAEAADVADEPAMQALVASIDPPLAGVFHAAGVIHAMPVLETDVAALRREAAPKVDGGWVLHRLTRDLALDHFVCFSSAAGVWGGSLEAAYAAACTFLDGLAQYRRARGLAALSVDWAPWAVLDVGGMMAADVAAYGETFGIHAMAPAPALDGMGRLMADRSRVQGVIGSIDWSKFRPVYEARRPRRLLARLESAPAPAAAPAAPAAAPASDVARELAALPRAAARARL
jgi:NAD(P)-dependent dehydrogenase (short-subunit alcohol dehydrogenase family)